MTDAAEAVTASSCKGDQDRLDTTPEPQIRVPNNTSAGPGLAAISAGANCSDAIDEFDLADRPHFDRTRIPLHGERLDKHGGDNVVACTCIGQQVVEHIAPTGPDPEMVMRVDDRQIGLKDRFLPPVKPILARDREQRRWLLCVSVERPRRRPSDQGDELAPFH
jgi:hypothetical protein